MGTYRVELQAVGGHGCNRQVVDGEAHIGCQRRDCPDCVARDFTRRMVSLGGNTVESSVLIHWPGQESEVRDDLLRGIRHGNF